MCVCLCVSVCACMCVCLCVCVHRSCWDGASCTCTGFTYVFGDSSGKTRDRQGQLGRVGVPWDDTHYHQLQTEGEGGAKVRLPKSIGSGALSAETGEVSV